MESEEVGLPVFQGSGAVVWRCALLGRQGKKRKVEMQGWQKAGRVDRRE
jgi:hypothetical protein